MGRARIGLVVMVLALALAPSVAFADVPVPGAAGLDAGDPGPDAGDPGQGVRGRDYGAGDSKYDTADPPYGAVAWAEPDPAPPGSDPARPASASCSAGTVALTFDDGPGPYTSRVLDLLARYRVRATFFVVGEQIQARPGLLRQIVARGHHVQNHTWSHPNLVTLSADRVRTELSRTTAAIMAAGAPRPTQARPPYGAMNTAVLKIMTAQRLTPIKWTIDTNDWRGLTPTQIRSTVLDELQSGAVVLMHDGLPTARNTLQALPGMIAGIRAAGYCFGFPRARSTAQH